MGTSMRAKRNRDVSYKVHSEAGFDVMSEAERFWGLLRAAEEVLDTVLYSVHIMVIFREQLSAEDRPRAGSLEMEG